MALLTITGSQVVSISGGTFVDALASAALTAGDVVYLNTAGKFALARNDLTTLEAKAIGLALHGASANQPMRVQTSGIISLGTGAAPVSGAVYALASTPGGIWLVSDILAAQQVTLIGIGIGTNQIMLNIVSSGVVK
jgi:citrate lyase beta subunit